MRDFDLVSLQKCELEILKEFVRICDKHNLKYYLAWGTFLGAVRHQGFIPWDDDLDVCMPYEDYLKFKEVCKTELGSDYFYEDWYAHREYFLSWAKLRKNNTTCMTRQEAKLKMHWGVCIDIFPLIPLRGPGLTFNEKIAFACLNLFIQRAHQPYLEDSASKKIKKILYAILPKCLDEFMIKKCYRVLGCGKKDAKYLYDFSDILDKVCVEKEVFGEGKMYQFEDIMVNGPSDADTYLTRAYGDDYMVIPPVEQRVTHGDIIVDIHKDYTYYQE